jgi:hypothetical protein
VHSIQAESIEDLVDASSTMICRRHRFGLHACTRLTEQVDCVDGEFTDEDRYVLSPHRRGRPKARQHYQRDPAVRSVLVYPYDPERSFDIVGSIWHWTQRPNPLVHSQIAAP